MTNTNETMAVNYMNAHDLVICVQDIKTEFEEMNSIQKNAIVSMANNTEEILYLVAEENEDGEWVVDKKLAKRLARRVVATYKSGINDARSNISEMVQNMTRIF